MRETTNKTIMIISRERQNVTQKAVVSVVAALVIIQYSVLVVRSKYTGNAMV